ncbi:DUF1800 family protein [Plantactinospora sp. GCM10030261]|uniref:DUF1800 family protein n=1 Tax=Plantactinospora sp. GCM10030261 TaxID=3273420 RepID=UPI00360BD1FC
MADHFVPPHRRDERQWDGREQPPQYGYHDHQSGPAHSWAERTGAVYADGPSYEDQGYPGPAAHPQSPAGPAYQPASYREPGAYQPAGYPERGAHQPAGAYPGYEPQRGPQWVGPDGLGARGTDGRGPAAALPDLADVDDDERTVARRKALVAFGGTAAVVVGGAALAMSPLGRSATDKLFGGGEDAVAAGSTPAGAAGQQPSTVRTYTEQNESYMGSRAGEALKRNSPTTGQLFGSPAEAARRTQVTVKTVLAKDPVRHLASRATFGPTPKVLADIRRMGIDAWLRQQLDADKIAPSKAELKLAELPTLKMTPTQLKAQRDSLRDRGIRADQEYIDATIARQIWSDRQLFEVMVDFWNDFLHVGPEFDNSDLVRGAFDRDVIRKHAMGNYADMLVAANRHPALLIYLNQTQSSKDEINENLARENLELYSVGVDGGYKEADVKAAAKLQTGRTINKDFEYVYQPGRHFVGKVKILGFTSANNTAEGGEQASEAYFRYLANHSSTARYVAQNLATRFVSDTPPKALVDRLAKTYTANKTAIKPVLMTLFCSSEFWAAVGQKVRRPMEYLVATYRTLGVSPEPSAGYQAGDSKRPAFASGLSGIRRKMVELGQFPTGQPTPDGYPDVFVAWTSAGTMINSWNEAATLIDGQRKEFSYAKPQQLVGKAPATAGAYVDALAKRLVHQTLSAKEKALILSIAGVPASAKVDAAFLGAVPAIARALLASPQHHLR